jgi:hypothetical protein
MVGCHGQCRDEGEPWPTDRERSHIVNLLRRHRLKVGAVALAAVGLIAALVVPALGASSQSTPNSESFVGVSPTRVLDDRTPPVGVAAAGPLGPGGTIELPLTTAAPNRPGIPVPAGAVSVLLNITVDSDATAPSFITVWPTGSPRPTTSVINPKPGTVVSGSILVPLGTGGRVSIFNLAGDVHVIVDLWGYTIALSGTGGAPGPQGPPGPPGPTGPQGDPAIPLSFFSTVAVDLFSDDVPHTMVTFTPPTAGTYLVTAYITITGFSGLALIDVECAWSAVSGESPLARIRQAAAAPWNGTLAVPSRIALDANAGADLVCTSRSRNADMSQPTVSLDTTYSAVAVASN